LIRKRFLTGAVFAISIAIVGVTLLSTKLSQGAQVNFVPLTPDRVAAAVEGVCGVKINWVDYNSDVTGDLYAVQNAEFSEEERERCGSFSINVYPEPLPESALVGERVDADGVRWTDVSSPQLGPSWLATKYFENVEFAWSSRERDLDDRWRALDEALSSLS
jgi:hypothetical protein